MSSSGQKTFLQYRAQDFPLYLFSLLVIGAVVLPAIEYTVPRILVASALAYLGVMFVIKHGWGFGAEAFQTLFSGVVRYPARVAASWWSVRSRVLQAVVLFALAIGIESLLRPVLHGSRWLDPFPWRLTLWVPFLAITAFRASILVAHLLRAKHVREVLQESPVRNSLDGASIYNHIVHAGITGFIAHLCLVAPCVLFFMYTDPTWLREMLLLAGYIIWCVLAAKTGNFTPVEQGGDGVPFRRGGYGRLFAENHATDHRSRFYFTVFHGHHHDAIPTALIGAAGGTGPLESADRVITWLEFFDSVTVAQLNWTITCVGDMLAHQYVPGVFPFSGFNLTMKNHHAAHHFGSLYPLGPFDLMNVTALDVRDGYNTNNARIRWYLDSIERHEGLTEERRKKFLSAHFVGHARARLGTITDKTELDLEQETRAIEQGLDAAIYETPAGDTRLQALEALWMRAVVLVRRYPKSAECAAWEGIALWRYGRELGDFVSRGTIQEACGKLKSAIAANPHVLQGTAHLTLGTAYAAVPNAAFRKRARAYLEKALEMAPDAVDRNVAFGELLLKLGDRDDARKALERALSAPPLAGRESADRAARARATELLESPEQPAAVSKEASPKYVRRGQRLTQTSEVRPS